MAPSTLTCYTLSNLNCLARENSEGPEFMNAKHLVSIRARTGWSSYETVGNRQ